MRGESGGASCTASASLSAAIAGIKTAAADAPSSQRRSRRCFSGAAERAERTGHAWCATRQAKAVACPRMLSRETMAKGRKMAEASRDSQPPAREKASVVASLRR